MQIFSRKENHLARDQMVYMLLGKPEEEVRIRALDGWRNFALALNFVILLSLENAGSKENK